MFFDFVFVVFLRGVCDIERFGGQEILPRSVCDNLYAHQDLFDCQVHRGDRGDGLNMVEFLLELVDQLLLVGLSPEPGFHP